MKWGGAVVFFVLAAVEVSSEWWSVLWIRADGYWAGVSGGAALFGMIGPSSGILYVPGWLHHFGPDSFCWWFKCVFEGGRSFHGSRFG